MGVLSSLALLALPLMKRPASPDVELTRLQAKINELERKLEDVERDRDGWRDIAMRWRARAERTTEFHAAQQLQAQMQLQHAHLNQQVAAQNFYGQGLPQMLGAQNFHQGLFGQVAQTQWPDCTCVPGRSALLRGDN